MKLAKASQQEIDTLMRWLQAREKTDDPPPPFMRVVFGYETLLDHCADPAADVLEFKPELKAAMEDKALLDAFDLAGRKDDVQARQISEDECEPELLGHFWVTPTVQSSSCRDAIRAAIG